MRQVLVFSTPTCVHCPRVKSKLKAAGIDFEDINAIENRQLTEQYQVRSVPAVIVIDEGEWQAYNENRLGELISV